MKLRGLISIRLDVAPTEKWAGESIVRKLHRTTPYAESVRATAKDPTTGLLRIG
jgi:hypothetical protein